ncbi:BspA family leucine-rich repeat surface protein [Flavobacterium poyangense]|uniref:BspA family leucine-rich repeat surface protein n=1 Tax=Flavobacterium poyangense TaxID=2204302 RepID=UPI00141FFD36|nr:BspA family leucine-rich repeat surface protein [Flavobacterium sp. JXAS1]
MNPSLFYEYGISKAATAFVSTWKTDNVSTGSSTALQVKLPLVAGGTYAFHVNWGDGSSNYITSHNQAEVLHTYASGGTYTITINGTCSGWKFSNKGDRLKILSVSSWGILRLGNYGGECFYGCANLDLSTVSDVLDLAGVRDLYSFFRDCFSLTTVNKINEWNTADVTSLHSMFNTATNFNQNIENWNVSKVLNFYSMFSSATVFNQPLNKWNTRAAKNMTAMFQSAKAFNQPLNNWNTAEVTNMDNMFTSAINFNQNIGAWNVSKVTSFTFMFTLASSFNNGGSPDINNWILNTSAPLRMDGMFSSAQVFNQPLSNWNTAEVTAMTNQFSFASNFNQNISTWNVSKVTNFNSMFNQAIAFNNGGSPDINNWILNVNTPVTMSGMFSLAQVFNQPLNDWNTSKVTNMTKMFNGCFAFNQPLNNWNTAAVTDMSWMFSNTSSFNQSISNWNTAMVTNMQHMFYNAPVFNQPLNNWNTTAVTNFLYMFHNAQAFNQTLNNWNTAAAININGMFRFATSFNQNISAWNITNVTDFTDFMADKSASNFSASNLDALYNSWSVQPVKPRVTISFGTIKYTSASAAARAILTGAPNNWQITDGGLAA